MYVYRRKAKMNDSRGSRFIRVRHLSNPRYSTGQGEGLRGRGSPVAPTSKCIQPFWNNCLFSTQVPLLVPAYLTQTHVICSRRKPHFVTLSRERIKLSHMNDPCFVHIALWSLSLVVLYTLWCFVVNCLSPSDVTLLCSHHHHHHPDPDPPSLVRVCASSAVLLRICS